MNQQQRAVAHDDNGNREIAVTYQHILYEVSDKIATITLHTARPHERMDTDHGAGCAPGDAGSGRG